MRPPAGQEIQSGKMCSPGYGREGSRHGLDDYLHIKYLCQGGPVMKPGNPFKAALPEKRPQIGLWLSMAEPYLAEVSATAGFD